MSQLATSPPVMVVMVVVVVIPVVVVVVMIIVVVMMMVMPLRDLYIVALGRLGPLPIRGLQNSWGVGDRLQQLGERASIHRLIDFTRRHGRLRRRRGRNGTNCR
jgi:hypothetical protein